MIKSGHKVVCCAPGDNPEITRGLEALGADYRETRLRRTGQNPIEDLVSIVSLTRLFKEEKADTILSYNIKPVIYGSIAANRAGVKNIFSLISGVGYAFMGETFKQRFLNALIRKPYRKALSHNRVVFFQNGDDLKLFQGLKLLGSKTKTILIPGTGIDLQHFKASPLRSPRPVFLLIARLLRDKGILEYAEAAQQLKARYPNAVFQLIGPYDSNPTGIKPHQVLEWERGGYIQFVGSVTDVRPFLVEASVYVLPSYREGTPRTVLEAMAIGRPVVTTDVPGCRDTVIDNENGFLVPAKNAAALAAAMERFIMEPALIETMGQRGRRIAVEKYDIDKVNRTILKAMALSESENELSTVCRGRQ